jgi:hypothetical protein
VNISGGAASPAAATRRVRRGCPIEHGRKILAAFSAANPGARGGFAGRRHPILFSCEKIARIFPPSSGRAPRRQDAGDHFLRAARNWKAFNSLTFRRQSFRWEDSIRAPEESSCTWGVLCYLDSPP